MPENKLENIENSIDIEHMFNIFTLFKKNIIYREKTPKDIEYNNKDDYSIDQYIKFELPWII